MDAKNLSPESWLTSCCDCGLTHAHLHLGGMCKGALRSRHHRTKVWVLLFTGIMRSLRLVLKVSQGQTQDADCYWSHPIFLCPWPLRAAATGKRSLPIQYLDVQRDKGDQAVVFDELYQLLIELTVVTEERVRCQVLKQVGEVQDFSVVVQVEG